MSRRKQLKEKQEETRRFTVRTTRIKDQKSQDEKVSTECHRLQWKFTRSREIGICNRKLSNIKEKSKKMKMKKVHDKCALSILFVYKEKK